MELKDCFPVWDRLTDEERASLTRCAVARNVSAGTLLHSGESDCVGLLAVLSGRLRAFIVSDEGREVTIYRLFERDICLFSASCMMRDIQFDVSIEAESDCRLLVIPSDIYRGLTERSALLANFTNELMAARFSEVMWLIGQIMWKSFDRRLAAFLIEQSNIENSREIRLTHEKIAANLGTAREVVTRMLKYFADENMIKLSRGCVELTDIKRLSELAGE